MVGVISRYILVEVSPGNKIACNFPEIPNFVANYGAQTSSQICTIYTPQKWLMKRRKRTINVGIKIK